MRIQPAMMGRLGIIVAKPFWRRGYQQGLASLLDAAERRIGGAAYFCNVHMLIERLSHRELDRSMRQAAWIFPDGKPIALAMRLFGYRRAERVAGLDAVPDLCRMAAERGLGIYFYGGSPDTIVLLKQRLTAAHPELKIVGAVSPPFRPLSDAEETAELARIEASGAHLCFVGLGCPKQELWIARNRGRTGAVLLGVGAAFNTVAGTLSRSPRWMQHAGLEWLYRLGQEPRRLWKRYAGTNPVFVNLLLRDLWSR
ncbi:MAG: WecB/TagA/CpsF family glycosyltransferase [Planctomycetes bacterium]|nr:WecB/TagA/CpsF family glycosyltransferase [Planctomycetota bacterium]